MQLVYKNTQAYLSFMRLNVKSAVYLVKERPFFTTFAIMLMENGTYTLLLLGWLRSSKEKDSESGLSYAGARYYDSNLSVFLSVDKFAEKYKFD